MDEITRKELAALTEIIVNTVPTDRIYLFGSHAYGTPGPDSDFDLYVVLQDDAPYRAVEATQKIRSAVQLRTKPLDIIATKKSRFESRLHAITLEQEVAERGVRLFG